jgi:hypothetical protein
MRILMGAALATGFLFAGIGAAAADDTVKLGGPSAQAAISGGTDTELVRWRHGGGYRYYTPYYGYYSPRAYYYPRTAAYYAPTYYYTPTYYPPRTYYRPAYYYYPIAGEAVPPPVTQAKIYYQTPAQQQYAPPQPLPSGNGTFPYDGGPPSPIPMPAPGADTNPASKPGGTVPLDGRLVSLPTQMTGGTSQYGAVSTTKTAAPRISYPAYGDEPITPAPRKR